MELEDIKTTKVKLQLQGLGRRKTKRIVALVSGGVDSTAVCKKLKEDGYEVVGLWINYRHLAAEAEWLCIQKQNKIKLTDKIFTLNLDLPFWSLPKSANIDEQGWIPGRNSLFMLLAGILAEKVNADGIAIGFMKQDVGVFGDNNLTHHKIVESLLTESMSREIKVLLPISNMTKKELIAYVKEYPTVSCWFPKVIEEEIIPCISCPNCKERMKHEAI